MLGDYRAIATMAAPPTIAMTSRFSPAVGRAAAPVWRPGEAWLPVVAEPPVGLTCTMVVEVMVLRLPSGMVVVLL